MTPQFFQRLESAKTVLLTGAGGGFDIFAGLPLYFALRNAGKTVHLANLSFSTIYGSTGQRIPPAMVVVNADTEANLRYFPERHLARWFRQTRHENVLIYCYDRTCAKPIIESYRALTNLLQPDAIVLVDGGTDSLMRGDEVGLGTPEEDMASSWPSTNSPMPCRFAYWRAWASAWTHSTAFATRTFWRRSRLWQSRAVIWARGR